MVLGFQLREDGRIEAIRIARSSGYAMLDRAAADSLKQVGPLPAGLAPSTAMELAIPVIYRLDG